MQLQENTMNTRLALPQQTSKEKDSLENSNTLTCILSSLVKTFDSVMIYWFKYD